MEIAAAAEAYAKSAQQVLDAARALTENPSESTRSALRWHVEDVMRLAPQVGRGQWAPGHPGYVQQPSVPLGTRVVGTVVIQVGPVQAWDEVVGPVRLNRAKTGYVVEAKSLNGNGRRLTLPWEEGRFRPYDAATHVRDPRSGSVLRN